jgi:hypothetical protein
MRKLSLVLAVAFPVVLLLLGPGCGLDTGMSGSAITESAPAHFAGDGIETSAEERM